MLKILVAEDEFINRRLLLKLLETYGECTVAVDGLGALEEFKKALEDEEPFQLIFLDIVMPNLGGIEVLKRIRQIETERNIPEDQRAKVIMTTAISDRQSVIQAAFNQCNAYLVKPVKQDVLIKKLNDLGILPEQEDAEEKTPTQKEEGAQPTSHEPAPPSDDVEKDKNDDDTDVDLPPEEEGGINPENLLDNE